MTFFCESSHFHPVAQIKSSSNFIAQVRGGNSSHQCHEPRNLLEKQWKNSDFKGRKPGNKGFFESGAKTLHFGCVFVPQLPKNLRNLQPFMCQTCPLYVSCRRFSLQYCCVQAMVQSIQFGADQRTGCIV